MASSSNVTTGSPGEKCPYPMEFVLLNYIVPKLSSTKDNYENWKLQMQDFIRSQDMYGFIDGTIAEPSHQHDHMAWKRSDNLVRGWILATLNEETRLQMLHLQIQTARDLWSELEEGFDIATRPTWDLGEKCPYPTEFVLLNTVPKLSSEDNYKIWKLQMRNFIHSQGLIGFIDDTVIVVEKSNQQDLMACERSNNLVRGWILATLNEETRLRMLDKQEQTARDLWLELEKRFDTTRPSLHPDTEAQYYNITYLELRKAAANGDWNKAKGIIENVPNTLRSPIDKKGCTLLHYAVTSRYTAAPVRARKNRFMKELLEKLTPTDVVDLVDDDGWTALHQAASANDVEGAKMLVNKNSDLPHVLDTAQMTPLHWAAFVGHREMVLYLTKVTRPDFILENDELAAKLLYCLTQGEFYDMALELLQKKPELAYMKYHFLHVLARKRSSFRSGSSSELNFWRFVLPKKSEGNITNLPRGGGGDIENPAPANCCISVGQRLHFIIWEVVEKFEEDDFTVPSLKHVREERDKQHYAQQLVNFLCMEVAKSNYSTMEGIFKLAIQNATRVGIPEIVEEIVLSYPPATGFFNTENMNIFQYAIMHRHERLFNLIYQMDGSWGWVMFGPEDSDDNTLHLAARLRHEQEINLKATVSGPVLQMQRELQWFEVVESLLPPSHKEERNKDGMTPPEVFIERHQDLVNRAEKWMKDTATSCTIVAALVATVVFAASITAPGGNDNLGHPLLLKRKAFKIFGISNALALFSSITSVLMFLLILTSRYREQDFLRTLPTRLIIGLATLFVSLSLLR